MNPQYDSLYKVMMVGDTEVGKSCLMHRFAEEGYMHTESYIPTIGADFRIHTTESEEKITKLQIWDTAGQERSRSITTSYYRGAHGVVVVYDITNQESFDHVQQWIEEADIYTNNSVKKILVGNKTDLEAKRKITYDTAKKYADSLGMPFVETSVKKGTNVKNVFSILTNEMKSSNEAMNPAPAWCNVNVSTGHNKDVDYGDNELSAIQTEEGSATDEQDVGAKRIYNGREKFRQIMSMNKKQLKSYFDSKSEMVQRLTRCGDISAKTDEDWKVLAVMIHSLECTGL